MLGKDKEEHSLDESANPPRNDSGQARKEKKELKEELKQARKERDEYLDGWKRAKADFINYKKEELARLEEVVKFANEDMIRDLIGVLDSFELALATLKGTPAEKGVYLIKTKLEDCLKKRGVSVIEVERGEKFNPNFHEAVEMVDPSSDGVAEGKRGKSDTIVEEVETGYLLHGKVIRPSRVKVYK